MGRRGHTKICVNKCVIEKRFDSSSPEHRRYASSRRQCRAGGGAGDRAGGRGGDTAGDRAMRAGGIGASSRLGEDA
eukprot:848844-Prymnesium_polylepis.1